MSEPNGITDLFGNRTIPAVKLDRNILASILCDEIKGISDTGLVDIIYSKYEAIIDFARLCNGEKAGEKISMLFNPHRYDTKTSDSMSIISALKDEKFISGLARATLFKQGKYKDLLYQVLQLGINGVQYINEFPPIIARKYYKERQAARVLDPCAGWGGRMIAAASVGAYYHGYEPATKTYNGLIRLGEFLRGFATGFEYKIECIPFEDATLCDDYDIALTSPPYYDTEIYTDENTNSCNRYKSFDAWVSGFYLPMIIKARDRSKCVILNVGTRRYDLRTPLLHVGAKEISSHVSGRSGLGKCEDGKERFYIIRKD